MDLFQCNVKILVVPENIPVILKYINVNGMYFLVYFKVLSFPIKGHEYIQDKLDTYDRWEKGHFFI